MSNEKYEQLIRSIELHKIELQSLECRQNRDFTAEKRNNIDIGIKTNVIETKYKGFELGVQTEFEVIAFNNHTDEQRDIDEVNEGDTLFKIKFILYLGYELDLKTVEDVLTEYEEEIEQFVEKNVPINAWPYVRETVSSITTRMGLPPLIIPTFKT